MTEQDIRITFPADFLFLLICYKLARKPATSFFSPCSVNRSSTAAHKPFPPAQKEPVPSCHPLNIGRDRNKQVPSWCCSIITYVIIDLFLKISMILMITIKKC